MNELFRSIPQVGCVDWIGLRPARNVPMDVVESATIDSEQGLVGDRYSGGATGQRMVTLIQAEHIELMSKLLKRDQIDPSLLRRNIVVSGVNLLAFHALKKEELELQVGQAILKCTGHCHPCSQMEKALGPGGYASMRGHGGITATVVQGGLVNLGDEVKLVS